MTAILATTRGDIIFDNDNIKQLTNCVRCGSAELKHDFSAGVMSDEYFGSKCEICGMNSGFLMGFWTHHFHLKNGFEAYWNMIQENHPLYNQLRREVGVEGTDENGVKLSVEIKEMSLSAKISEMLMLWENEYKRLHPEIFDGSYTDHSIKQEKEEDLAFPLFDSDNSNFEK